MGGGKAALYVPMYVHSRRHTLMLHPSSSHYRLKCSLLQSLLFHEQLSPSLQGVEYSELCDLDFTSQAKRQRQSCAELLPIPKSLHKLTLHRAVWGQQASNFFNHPRCLSSPLFSRNHSQTSIRSIINITLNLWTYHLTFTNSCFPKIAQQLVQFLFCMS